MYLFKKSLLISSYLFLGISPTWGMDENLPDKKNLRHFNLVPDKTKPII